MDYLIKHKLETSGDGATSAVQEDNAYQYAMGPRALIEVGRKQIIYFCAQVLDQEPDPTMLQELANENDDKHGDDDHHENDMDMVSRRKRRRGREDELTDSRHGRELLQSLISVVRWVGPEVDIKPSSVNSCD
eukprot:CAMPEP_0197236362 /NCGR_PEP_ID=MMETSP1429-20130617/3486_1 /TAXON_ID=49237 /ORGANISM="Chaetoceros  sp., Strain UNC1202" /LENGTH=132 /DNA_ID=CAMNT_0042695121 /DNA_START=24 /DNA_END=423 /DNA_ORIENTATION=-